MSWKVRPALRPSDDSTNVYIFVCLIVIISAAVNRGYHLPTASHDQTLGTDIRKKMQGQNFWFTLIHRTDKKCSGYFSHSCMCWIEIWDRKIMINRELESTQCTGWIGFFFPNGSNRRGPCMVKRTYASSSRGPGQF